MSLVFARPGKCWENSDDVQKKSTSRLPYGQGEKAGEFQKRTVRAGCNELAEDTYGGDDCLTDAGQTLATLRTIKRGLVLRIHWFFHVAALA